MNSTANTPAAVIDMGTNTFLLLIGKWENGRMQLLHREQQFVRLGKGGISDGRITDEAIKRGISTLYDYKEKIDRHRAAPYLAVATSALRNAKNQRQVLDEFEAALGIRPLVIDGDKEAQLIYEGVRLTTPPTSKTVLVMDIGGGSVEFILGQEDTIQWKQSFEIGAQRLCDQFFSQDPIPEDSIQALKNYLHQELAPLRAAFQQFEPQRFIGSAGTFDTLWDLHVGKLEDFPSERLLSYQDYLQVFNRLISLPLAERLRLPGMVDKRVEMIVVASCLVTYIFQLTGISEVHIANGALKEGVLNRILQQKSILDES